MQSVHFVETKGDRYLLLFSEDIRRCRGNILMPMKAPLMPACIVINHLVTHTGNSTKFAQFNEQGALVRWEEISLCRSVSSQRHFTDKAAGNAMKYSRIIR